MSINFANTLNLAVAFVLELMVLAVYFCVNLLLAGSGLMRYGVAVATTGVVIALWATFAAPRSQRRLTIPSLYFFKISVFGGAAAILWMAHWIHLEIAFVLICIFSLVLEATQSKR